MIKCTLIQKVPTRDKEVLYKQKVAKLQKVTKKTKTFQKVPKA